MRSRISRYTRSCLVRFLGFGVGAMFKALPTLPRPGDVQPSMPAEPPAAHLGRIIEVRRQLVEPFQQRRQRGAPDLPARHPDAEAEMVPDAERDRALLGPVDVEAVGV